MRSRSRTEVSRAEVMAGVGTIAREQLEYTGEVREDLRLIEDLRLDSIRLLTLAMEVEDRFQICLDEGDEAALVTVGDLVTTVLAKLSAGPSAEALPDGGTAERA